MFLLCITDILPLIAFVEFLQACTICLSWMPSKKVRETDGRLGEIDNWSGCGVQMTIRLLHLRLVSVYKHYNLEYLAAPSR